MQAPQHIQDLAPEAQGQKLEAWKVGEDTHSTPADIFYDQLHACEKCH